MKPSSLVTLFLVLILACSARAAEGPPNILLALADDWSAHAGAYGTPWVKTPAFDRVAHEGLLLTRVYTPTAKCAPSRASILTGRNPWQLKEAANHLCYFPSEFKTWMEALTEHGWFTGFTMKGWGPGVANQADGTPRQMTGKPFNKRRAPPPTAQISDNDYAGNFTDFLNAAPEGKPWCFWYGSIEPHRGYEYGSGGAKGGKKLSDIDRVPGYWPDNEAVRNDLLDYAYEIEHFDRHLGRMLAELEQRGLLENTVVIVTSDHGMPFPRVKGNAYAFANHVPFAVRWPGGIAKPGRVVEDLVSFIDLAPTLMEVAGLKWAETGMAPSSGRSLLELFRSDAKVAARDHVLIGRERTDIGRPHDGGYPIRGIIKGDDLYLKNFEPARWPAGNPETGYLDCDGGPTKTFILDAHRKDATDPFWEKCFGMRPAEERYDLRRDPDCMKNLALLPSNASLQSELREQMEAELREQGDPRMRGNGRIFDEYRHSNPANRGYYERFMLGEKMTTPWVNETDFEPVEKAAPAK